MKEEHKIVCFILVFKDVDSTDEFIVSNGKETFTLYIKTLILQIRVRI